MQRPADPSQRLTQPASGPAEDCHDITDNKQDDQPCGDRDSLVYHTDDALLPSRHRRLTHLRRDTTTFPESIVSPRSRSMSQPAASVASEEDVGLMATRQPQPTHKALSLRQSAGKDSADLVPELDISEIAIGRLLPLGLPIGGSKTSPIVPQSTFSSRPFNKNSSSLVIQPSPLISNLAAAFLSPKHSQAASGRLHNDDSKFGPLADTAGDLLDTVPSLSAFGVFKDSASASSRNSRKLIDFAAAPSSGAVHSPAHISPTFVEILPLPWINQSSVEPVPTTAAVKASQQPHARGYGKVQQLLSPRGLSMTTTTITTAPLISSPLSKPWSPMTASPSSPAVVSYRTPMTIYMTPHATALDLHYAATPSPFFATGTFDSPSMFATPLQGDDAFMPTPTIDPAASASIPAAVAFGGQAEGGAPVASNAYAHQASAMWRASLALLAVAIVLVLAALGFLGRTLRKRTRPASTSSRVVGDEKGSTSSPCSASEDDFKASSPHIGASSPTLPDPVAQSRIYHGHLGASAAQKSDFRQSVEAGLGSLEDKSMCRDPYSHVRALNATSAGILTFAKPGLPRPRRVLTKSRKQRQSLSTSSAEPDLTSSTSTAQTSVDTHPATPDKTFLSTDAAELQIKRASGSSEQSSVIQYTRPVSPAVSAASDLSAKSTFSIKQALSVVHKAVTASLYSAKSSRSKSSDKTANKSFRGLPISYPVVLGEQDIGLPRHLPRPTTEDYSRLVNSVLLTSASLASLPKAYTRDRQSLHTSNIAGDFELATNGFTDQISRDGSFRLSGSTGGRLSFNGDVITTSEGQRDTLDSLTSIGDTRSVSASERRSSLYNSVIREQHVEQARRALEIRASNITETTLAPAEDALLHFPLPVLHTSVPSSDVQDPTQSRSRTSVDVSHMSTLDFGHFGSSTQDVLQKPASVRRRTTLSTVDSYETAKLDASVDRRRYRYSHVPDNARLGPSTGKGSRPRSNTTATQSSSATISASSSADMLVASRIPVAVKGQAIRMSGAQAAAAFDTSRPTSSFAHDLAASVADPALDVSFETRRHSQTAAARRVSFQPSPPASFMGKRHSDFFASVATGISADSLEHTGNSSICPQIPAVSRLAEDDGSIYSRDSQLRDSAVGVLRVVNA